MEAKMILFKLVIRDSDGDEKFVTHAPLYASRVPFSVAENASKPCGNANEVARDVSTEAAHLTALPSRDSVTAA